MILFLCSLAASPFGRPLRAGFVVSLVAYRLSVRQGGSVCAGATFSVFLGIPFMFLCMVDSLDMLGMPGFLLVGLTGRGGDTALRL